MDIDAIHRTLKAATERKVFEKWRFFVPVPKQEAFFDTGATYLERLLMAGNRLGKCISCTTPVFVVGRGRVMAGALFNEARPFSVLSYDADAGRVAEGVVSHVVKKPPEPMVRLWFKNGDYVEAAWDHRMMDRDGQWRFVRQLFAILPCLLPSNLVHVRSVQSEDDPGSTRTVEGSLAGCFLDCRRDGEQPLRERGAGLSLPPSQAGARQHIHASFDWGDLGHRHTSISRPDVFPPSNPDVCRRYVDLSAGSEGRAVCIVAPPTTGSFQGLWRIPPGLVFASQSDRAGFLREYGEGMPLADPLMEGNRLIAYEPIPCQAVYDFTVLRYHNYITAGAVHHNTEGAAYEFSRHLTGEYPDWWKGKRYDRPVRAWGAGTSAVEVRDTIQEKLCGAVGNPEAFGSGMIPKAAFAGDPRASRSAQDAFDSLQVRHKSGGVSRVVFKTYEQDRRHWQGAELDLIWFDEEPPTELYTEGRTRLGGKGMSMMTFTPLFGMSDVVRRFVDEEHPLRTMVRYGIKDARFMSDQQREALLAGYPAHEREQRANGEPLFSEGRIFRVPEDDLMEPPILAARVPVHWKKLWGIDFGIDHPFAAVLLAWDVEEGAKIGQFGRPTGPIGTIHILAAIRMRGAIPLQHVDAMRRIAANIPVAWPHDGHVRDRGSGEALSKVYRGHGLNMLAEHATHPSGGFSTEAGIMDMDAYMQARQWKVNDTLTDWFGEYGQYHRKDGQIVKVRDDLMSATRIAHMMRRAGKQLPLGSKIAGRGQRPTQAAPINPWTGRAERAAHTGGVRLWQ